MTYKRITLAIDKSVATITLAYPKVMNATSPAMMGEMRDALDQIAEPKLGVRCLLITGHGRAFCAGADLTDEAIVLDGGATYDAGGQLEYDYNPIFRRLRSLPIPIVTAVNGAAAGVGVSFALAGDIVLAARSAYFLLAFSRVGLVADGGSSWILPRLIGLARTRELCLLGEKLPAEKALDWGMINRICEDDTLMADATAIATRFASGPTVALGLLRRLCWDSPTNSYDEQLNLEREFQRVAGGTKDFKEGVDAFTEKRPPRFTGQ